MRPFLQPFDGERRDAVLREEHRRRQAHEPAAGKQDGDFVLRGFHAPTIAQTTKSVTVSGVRNGAAGVPASVFPAAARSCIGIALASEPSEQQVQCPD